MSGALQVGGGGTGIITGTAYAPLCGGTAATLPFQQATSGFSTSGYVLTSTGAGSLPTWQAPAGGGGVTVVNNPSTSYPLVLADENTWQRMTAATLVTITVPTNASVAFPTGTQVSIFQATSALINIVPAGGVTVNSKNGYTYMAAEFSQIVLTKVGTDEWDMTGDVNPYLPQVWISRTPAATKGWQSIAYGAGVYVALASNQDANCCMTSPDGVTWTTRTVATATTAWFAIVYGNSQFVAVGSSSGASLANVMTSPDGITWTARNGSVDNDFRGVAWNGSVYAAVSVDGTGDRVMTSPDGITWTTRVSAVDSGWSSIAWGGTQFVAVAQSGAGARVMTSPDGITWTSRTAAAANTWTSVKYGNGVFVACSNDGSGNRIMTSSDGVTWVSRTTGYDNQWSSVSFGAGIFIVAGQSGTGTRIMYSENGITWFNPTTPPADEPWLGSTFGDLGFIAVGNTAGAVTQSVT